MAYGHKYKKDKFYQGINNIMQSKSLMALLIYTQIMEDIQTNNTLQFSIAERRNSNE